MKTIFLDADELPRYPRGDKTAYVISSWHGLHVEQIIEGDEILVPIINETLDTLLHFMESYLATMSQINTTSMETIVFYRPQGERRACTTGYGVLVL